VWSFAENVEAERGQIVDRKNWRVLMSWHIAEPASRLGFPAELVKVRA
jgi:hypothetical protein